MSAYGTTGVETATGSVMTGELFLPEPSVRRRFVEQRCLPTGTNSSQQN